VYEQDARTRAERYRERRARYRKWLLLICAVLVVLFSGIVAYAGIFTRGDGGSKAAYPAAKVGEERSSSVAPHETQGTNAPSAAKSNYLADEGTAGTVASPSSEATQDPADKPAPKGSSETLDVLVLGVDRLPSAAEGSSTRSDTIMLVRVTPSTGDVKLLSVPRDLYVEVEPGVKDRINTAYTYGGVKQARAVMEGLTGVKVDGYVIADFEGFEKVIAAIGGVKVDVGHGVFPEKWHMGEGVERLGGRKALFYARYRGTACGDLDRIDRQQRFLAALREQAIGWNTITRVPQIVKVTNENVDTDLGVLQAISLARALVLHGEEGEMSTAELEGNPTTLPDGEQVLMPETKANEVTLQDFRDDAPKERRSGRAPRSGGQPSPEGSSSKC
jgi:polyisoprenyl-teichoic acid--peptidoglycan teichoic acid transferase